MSKASQARRKAEEDGTWKGGEGVTREAEYEAEEETEKEIKETEEKEKQKKGGKK